LPAENACPRLDIAAGVNSAKMSGTSVKPMRNRSNNNVERLRLAIDCLPVTTREAMLAGLQASERVIAGAYVDEQGGVCPMLAAHRAGGRTDGLAFARSWDRFTHARGKPRAATARELRILVRHLQDSLQSASNLDLGTAIAEHRKLVIRGRCARRKLVQALDPTGEIIARRLRTPRPGGQPRLAGTGARAIRCWHP
jgi:hypothetical protein